jgi:hypothetical protein
MYAFWYDSLLYTKKYWIHLNWDNNKLLKLKLQKTNDFKTHLKMLHTFQQC